MGGEMPANNGMPLNAAPPTTRPPTTPPAAPPPGGTSWATYTPYAIGQVVSYNGVRHQCRQAHTSLPGWELPNILALWLPI